MDIEKIKNVFNKYIVSVLNKDGFNKYFVDVLKKQYTDFKGRASRSQYWYYIMFYTLIAIPLTIVDALLFGQQVLSGLLGLATVVPCLAMSVRRFHDLGKPWFWFLIALVPVVGPIALIFWFCQPGEAKTNQWGEPSK